MPHQQFSSYKHSGCLTCKRRRKKCDLGKPICKTCIRLNLRCDQPDLFRPSNLSRSYPKQRQGDSTTSAVALSPEDHYIGNDEDAVTDAETSFLATTFDHQPSLAPLNHCQIQPPLHSRRSPLESFLLQHYMERSSSVLLNVDGPANSLRSIVLPRARASSMLTNAVYAVSSLHVSVWNVKPEFRIAALTYSGDASRALQQSLNNFSTTTTMAERECALLTSIFFCKYEIVAGGFKDWRPHLRGLYKMLCAFENSHAEISPDVAAYVRSFIAYHWYISSITKTDTTTDISATPIDADEDLHIDLHKGPIDPYMGTASFYIELLHSVASLKSGCTADVNAYVFEIAALARLLVHQGSNSTTNEILAWLQDDTSSDLTAISSAYKYAVIIHLHNALDRIDDTRRTDVVALHIRSIYNMLSCSKEQAVTLCMEQTTSVGENSPFAVGLAPLLFIIATETTDSVEADAAFARLVRLWHKSCLGNLGTAVGLLESIRQAETRDWRSILSKRRWDLIVS